MNGAVVTRTHLWLRDVVVIYVAILPKLHLNRDWVTRARPALMVDSLHIGILSHTWWKAVRNLLTMDLLGQLRLLSHDIDVNIAIRLVLEHVCNRTVRLVVCRLHLSRLLSRGLSIIRSRWVEEIRMLRLLGNGSSLRLLLLRQCIFIHSSLLIITKSKSELTKFSTVRI